MGVCMVLEELPHPITHIRILSKHTMYTDITMLGLQKIQENIDRTNFTVNPAIILPAHFILSRGIAGTRPPIRYVMRSWPTIDTGNTGIWLHWLRSGCGELRTKWHHLQWPAPRYVLCTHHVAIGQGPLDCQTYFSCNCIHVYPAMAGFTAQRGVYLTEDAKYYTARESKGIWSKRLDRGHQRDTWTGSPDFRVSK